MQQKKIFNNQQAYKAENRSQQQDNVRILQKLQTLLNHRQQFENQIYQFQNNQLYVQDSNNLNNQNSNTQEERDFTICVRARPVLQHEVDKNYFNIVTAQNPDIILHNAKLNVKSQPVIENQKFNIDYAFGPQNSNQQIYDITGKPLVQLALNGGLGTIFAYGQTGSGKTYTMQGMLECISNDIFQQNMNNNNIYVGFFELLGNKASCLINQNNNVDILEDQFGKVQIKGISENQVRGQKEFLQLSQYAQQNRKTQATFKNDVSSRTHSICQIRIQNSQVPNAEDGYLYLVDLVGSENASDSQFHDKNLFNETKEINKSLMALKDCLRNRSQAAIQQKVMHVPYRQSKLTLLLKDSFDIYSYKQAKTVVIANVAPCIADYQQTVNTLRYAAPIKISQNLKGNREIYQNPENPQFWDNETLRQNLVVFCQKYSRSIQVNLDQVIPFETGKQFLGMNEGIVIQRLVDQGFTPKVSKNILLEVFQRFADHRYYDKTGSVYKSGKISQPVDSIYQKKEISEEQKNRIAQQKEKFRQKQQEKQDKLQKILNNNKYTVGGKKIQQQQNKNQMEIEE